MIALERLRPRLTLWYAGSFAALLAVLGTTLFVALTRQRSAELDRSLEQVAAEVTRAATIRLTEGFSPDSALALARRELESPDVAVYILSGDGSPLEYDMPPPELSETLPEAPQWGRARAEFTTAAGERWRVHAARFEVRGAPSRVVAVASDVAAIERHYARLIEIFISLGLAALAPIVLGGYQLARATTAPALDSLRRFTADAAHELRTPVAVLRATAEIAAERERSASEYRAALDAVQKEARRLGEVVDDLLLLARAEGTSRTREPQRIYLDDLASDAVARAGALARARGVRLAIGDYMEAVVRGDAVLLRRLLMILLDNAIKFTPEGNAVRLDVTARDGVSTIVVEDQGIGIAPQELAHVFDRFYRTEAGRTRAEGSGLGLAIARRICDIHGARIAVDSEPGRGTRITVSFPRQKRGLRFLGSAKLFRTHEPAFGAGEPRPLTGPSQQPT
jgi:signal transduction histidine kinase